MKIYLAGPFFNEAQVAVIEALEQTFSKHDVFSPRSEGVLSSSTAEERRAMASVIFRSNCDNIEAADLVFAVIDDRDPGTIFEIGYAYGCLVPVVTYSNQNYGVNVMIAQCSRAHIQGLDQARKLADWLMTNPIEELDWKKAESVT
jgi:nucleoside deoxyribosyltransferase